jgi:hypothetical protein
VSIVERAADAAVMFWQSLDDREKRMLAVGVIWAAYVLVSVPVSKARQDRDRQLLADAVAERLVRHG